MFKTHNKQFYFICFYSFIILNIYCRARFAFVRHGCLSELHWTQMADGQIGLLNGLNSQKTVSLLAVSILEVLKRKPD